VKCWWSVFPIERQSSSTLQDFLLLGALDLPNYSISLGCGVEMAAE
jgi:hypothetical protein